MRSFPLRIFFRLSPGLALAVLSPTVLACASCGCTLSSEWQSQGLTTQQGLSLDLRYDYLDQNQLRSGTSTISPAQASARTTATGDAQEVERYTRNNYVTLGLDYAFNRSWGVNVQVPYIVRDHSTQGLNSPAGASPGDGAYDSNTSNLGDVKVIGRFQGFGDRHNFGVTYGLKLPTGRTSLTGISTDPTSPATPAPIDRGLQPGTGTTDAILGAYYFDALNKSFDYFTQVSGQAALTSYNGYKPGVGYNANLGLRYMELDKLMPQLQVNVRYVRHDTGVNADTTSTGGTLSYLSPGLTYLVNKKLSVYSFVQLPLYQDVKGVQLNPTYTASVGLHYTF